MKNKLPKVIVIVGTTASGKTALSLKIAKKFNGEIVSADSRQIYRGMDIGTAKPTKEELKKIKHHLINIKNPRQDYSVGQYKKDALVAIRKILKIGKLPIIVGGTGLYVSAMVNNLDFPEVEENKKLRAKLEKEIKTKGLKYVFKKLVELDPESAYIVDPNNPRRVIRAMEVAILTGQPFSSQRKSGPPLFDFLQIGLKILPETLKEKIQKRTAQMIKNGLVEEVKKLVKKYGYKPKAFEAIGYREIIDFLRGKINLKEAEDLINKNTWHYARRQMTWFRKDPAILWFDFKPVRSSLAEVLQTRAKGASETSNGANQKMAKKKVLRAISKFILS
ncbi:MAG: tRNA (adenosine(37)-N6)-dimethylallyltransferase MiaA [Candidatus Yanofskybacteria bacterium]|nr:tRNA (adenosine(37)-N6)-dimethylallyltransferase MiaA [Candidatus Yanofskybacteria bacterium]